MKNFGVARLTRERKAYGREAKGGARRLNQGSAVAFLKSGQSSRSTAMAESFLRSRIRPDESKDKATEQFSRVADQTEGVATRLAEQGREADERMQQVSGNMKRALDTSLQDQPMATLAMAAVVGFVIGAIWKS
jgi:ElaB/YqjD/DUF883 family membrane-anchored ribosome-binding protein